MSAICIIDTSIYCNLLNIPRRSQDHKEVTETFEDYISEGYTFLLPMATIYETGNHIGQNGDGNMRRKKAELFKYDLNEAFDSKAPWTITPLATLDDIREWLDEFPDWAMKNDSKGKGPGFGDLAIMKIWEQQCPLHAARRVFIWTFDEHLKDYNRIP